MKRFETRVKVGNAERAFGSSTLTGTWKRGSIGILFFLKGSRGPSKQCARARLDRFEKLMEILKPELKKNKTAKETENS